MKSIEVKSEVIKIKTSWNVEMSKDLETFQGFDVDRFSKILSKEIRLGKRKEFIQKILNK